MSRTAIRKMCVTVHVPRPGSSCDHIFETPMNLSSNLSCSLNETWSFWTDGELDVQNSYHPGSAIDLNYSEYNFPNEIWIHRNEGEMAGKILSVIPLVIFGVAGNIAIISVVIRNTSLRSPTNMLLANMAAADCLTLIICPPMFIASDLFQNYVLGSFGCKTEGFFSCALLLTAVFNLCIVSYDRLTAIALPPEAKLTTYATKVIMMVTWITGFITAVPLILCRHYKERQWKNFLEQYCAEDVNVLPVYWYIILILLVWVPLSVTTVSYTTIFMKLDHYEKKMRRTQKKVFVSYKTKVARTMFIILLVFVVCRAPYTALIFERSVWLALNDMNQVSDSFHVLWFVSKYLLYVNAAINPLIYGFTNENFRRAFRVLPVSKWFFGSSSLVMTPVRGHKQQNLQTPMQNTTKKNKKGERNMNDQPQQWFVQPKHLHLSSLSSDVYM